MRKPSWSRSASGFGNSRRFFFFAAKFSIDFSSHARGPSAFRLIRPLKSERAESSSGREMPSVSTPSCTCLRTLYARSKRRGPCSRENLTASPVTRSFSFRASCSRISKKTSRGSSSSSGTILMNPNPRLSVLSLPTLDPSFGGRTDRPPTPVVFPPVTMSPTPAATAAADFQGCAPVTRRHDSASSFEPQSGPAASAEPHCSSSLLIPA
ncbi:hypothetical protein T484DRAFT_1937038 [Baffinella frigidus]|nr:hypothetical protein T484DRAFT_1937038 [Cryptophyta sp. CCMP2293]